MLNWPVCGLLVANFLIAKFLGAVISSLLWPACRTVRQPSPPARIQVFFLLAYLAFSSKHRAPYRNSSLPFILAFRLFLFRRLLNSGKLAQRFFSFFRSFP